MNNRLPVYFLGILALIAIIWRMLNPPLPPVPGPIGSPTNWRAELQIGLLDCQAASPDGSKWAGAWNKQKPARGSVASVRIIGLSDTKSNQLTWSAPDGQFVNVICWRDNQILAAVCKPAVGLGALTICEIDATTAKTLRTTQVPNAVRAIAWPSGSAILLCEVGSSVHSQGPKVALISIDTAKPVGLPIQLPAVEKSDDISRPFFALSPNGVSFVIATVDITGKSSLPTYYLGDAKTGTVDHLFTGDQLPGRVTELHMGPKGILVICSLREKMQSLMFDLGKRSLVPFAPVAANVKADWPTCPAEIRYVTYNGASVYDVATGASKLLVDLSKLTSSQERWRSEVRDGRFFPRPDGSLTTLSVKARVVDIRIINKQGGLQRDILPRR